MQVSYRASRRASAVGLSGRSGEILPSPMPVARTLFSSLELEGPADHAYDAFSWQRAQAMLRYKWKNLTADERLPTETKSMGKPTRAEIRRGIVEMSLTTPPPSHPSNLPLLPSFRGSAQSARVRKMRKIYSCRSITLAISNSTPRLRSGSNCPLWVTC